MPLGSRHAVVEKCKIANDQSTVFMAVLKGNRYTAIWKCLEYISGEYVRSFLKNVTIAVLYIFVMSICQIKQNNFIVGPQNVNTFLLDNINNFLIA